MKKGILLIVCLLSFSSVYSQDFEKGGNYISIGYNLDPFRGNNYMGHGGSFAYERGITDVLGIGRIGVGGSVSTMLYNYNSTVLFNDHKHNVVRVSIGARATYHFEFDVPKMDVYAGVGAVFNIDIEEEKFNGTTVKKETHIGGNGTRSFHQVFAGIRYYFTDAFGVYAEVGHGHRLANIGVVFAF